MRKLFKKLHLWLALPAGIVITVTCLTGAILVFQDEIQELCLPKRYTVSGYENREPMSFAELVPIVNAQLDDNEVASVQTYPHPKKTYRMGLKNGRRVTAFVNPYTGEVIAVSTFSKSFFGNVMMLHRWLMFEGKARQTGKVIVGVSTIFFVFILISGIAIWFPRNRKQARQAFSIKWKSGRRRLWYDAHRVLGFYAALILLMLALTGLMWSFSWYRDGVTNLLTKRDNKETPPRSNIPRNGNTKTEEKNIDYTIWQHAIASLPNDYKYAYVRVENGAISALPLSAWHERAIDRFSFDKESGEITAFQPFLERPARSNVMSINYILHTGKFGGFLVKVLMFLAALIGASLPVTGYWLWWRKRR